MLAYELRKQQADFEKIWRMQLAFYWIHETDQPILYISKTLKYKVTLDLLTWTIEVFSSGYIKHLTVNG